MHSTHLQISCDRLYIGNDKNTEKLRPLQEMPEVAANG